MTRLSVVWATLSSAEQKTAAGVLGGDHGLVRVLAYKRAFAIQLLVTSVPLLMGAVGTTKHVSTAATVLEAGCLVELALVVAFLLARSLVRERAQELIAAGIRSEGLSVIARERQRLLSMKEREGLARSLESALEAAQHWDEILPASRPPHGVRCLRFTAREIREITALLRSETPDARGVALTARFLAGGYGSSLYGGDVVALRGELNRIHYLLATPAQVQTRAAA